MGPKKIWGPKNFGTKKCWVWKIFSPQKFRPKISDAKKFWVQEILGTKTMAQKNLGVSKSDLLAYPLPPLWSHDENCIHSNHEEGGAPVAASVGEEYDVYTGCLRKRCALLARLQDWTGGWFV